MLYKTAVQVGVLKVDMAGGWFCQSKAGVRRGIVCLSWGRVGAGK